MCAHTSLVMVNKKIRIVDIARLADVSPGTVDRVIHNRGRIAPDKKARIEEIIKQVGYKPNIAARMLAIGRTYSIAAVVPSYVDESYWGQVCEGCIKAAEELGQGNIKVDFIYFDLYDRHSFDRVTFDIDWELYDSVVIAALFEEQTRKLSTQLDAIDKPYIYIDSLVDGESNLAYFGVDAYASGRIAGKMLCCEIDAESAIVIVYIQFRRNEITPQMRKREEGLLQYLRESGRESKVEYIEYNPEQPDQTTAALRRIIGKGDKKVGVVVLNSRVYELVASLASAAKTDTDTNMREQISMLGFDAIMPNIKAMNEGWVRVLISQRPKLQGYNAVKALSNFFLFDALPNRINHTPIDILIPENIGYYTD